MKKPYEKMVNLTKDEKTDEIVTNLMNKIITNSMNSIFSYFCQNTKDVVAWPIEIVGRGALTVGREAVAWDAMVVWRR